MNGVPDHGLWSRGSINDVLQAILYLSLALASQEPALDAGSVAKPAAVKLAAQSESKPKVDKATAQKAAKKKAEAKKSGASKSKSSKAKTASKSKSKTKVAAESEAPKKPVEGKTPWVVPDKKAIAAQKAKPNMTQAVAKAVAEPKAEIKPVVSELPPPAPVVVQIPVPLPVPVTPAPVDPSSANPLADILPPEVIAAAKKEYESEQLSPSQPTSPVSVSVAAALPPLLPPVAVSTPPAQAAVVEPSPVLPKEVTVAQTPVLTPVKPVEVSPPVALTAPAASTVVPATLQPKAVLPPKPVPTTVAKAVKVDAYSRDYEGPKTGRELQYDSGIARAFGSKTNQMGALEGSWLVSSQAGQRLLSLELRDKGVGGQIEGAWRSLIAGFGLNKSGFVSDASISTGNELNVSYVEKGASTATRLKLNRSEDGRWRGMLTDPAGKNTPVIMLPDSAS